MLAEVTLLADDAVGALGLVAVLNSQVGLAIAEMGAMLTVKQRQSASMTL